MDSKRNLPWRFHRIVSDDEIEEAFDTAEPCKDYQAYSGATKIKLHE